MPSFNPPPSLDDDNSSYVWSASQQQLPLHAPIPLSGCAPILTHDAFNPPRFTPYPSQAQFHPPEYSSIHPCDYPLTSHPTFLTPSELLVELSSQSNQAAHSLQQTRALGYALPNVSSPDFNRLHLPTTTIPDSPLFLPPFPDSQNSETITSHEKKRHYLECLEQYIAFLHDHSRRVGIEPVPLERISTYRCLNSRSIRSLLIHMEKTTKQMQERIYTEEQKFLRLRDALQRQESVIEAVQGIQHEI